MLNGIDPVLVIQFKKSVKPAATTTPAASIPTPVEESFINLPVIPIYLSETITGLIIDTEDKTIDIETETETTETGGKPQQKQKGQGSTVKITLQAERDSIGATLLSALMDQVFEKLTSKEYGITYVHGAVTMFDALVHGYSVQQVADTTLLTITLELTRSTVKAEAKPTTPQVSNGVPGTSLSGPAVQ